MAVLPPKIGAHLLEATRSRDLDEAFGKVFTDYLALKTQDLQQTIAGFEEKWGMDFRTFKQRTKEEALSGDPHGYATERDFWRWEEAETLKQHYERVQREWT